jgi:hypothetical protein
LARAHRRAGDPQEPGCCFVLRDLGDIIRYVVL